MERGKIVLKVGEQVFEIATPFSTEFWKWFIERFVNKKTLEKVENNIINFTQAIIAEVVDNFEEIIKFFTKMETEEIFEKIALEDYEQFRDAFFTQFGKEVAENPFLKTKLQQRVLALGLIYSIEQKEVEKIIKEITEKTTGSGA